MTRPELVKKLVAEGKSTTEIAEELGITEVTVLRYQSPPAKKSSWEREKQNKKRPKTARPTLVFGDLHAPYHHPDALKFLEHVHKEYNCLPRVYCTGDMFDFHSMSRHVKELDAPPPDEEYGKAREFAAELSALFPCGTLVLGNHDLIPQRQMQTLGISTRLLMGYNTLYNLPTTWTIEPVYAIMNGTTLLEHGINSCGMNGAINTGLTKQCNFVQGHAHSFAGVSYRASIFALRWAMNTGCLADHKALASRYAVHAKNKGVLGCGLIYPASKFIAEHAIFLPMNT